MNDIPNENVEDRITRMIAERHQCERALLGATFLCEHHQYEIFVVDQTHSRVDARRLPGPAPMQKPDDYTLLGVPIADVMRMVFGAFGVGCTCGHHIPVKVTNQVEQRHRSAAFAVLASGRNFEIWWRDGDEVFQRNCPGGAPEYKQELDALNRLAQQIADLDPAGKP